MKKCTSTFLWNRFCPGFVVGPAMQSITHLGHCLDLVENCLAPTLAPTGVTSIASRPSEAPSPFGTRRYTCRARDWTAPERRDRGGVQSQICRALLAVVARNCSRHLACSLEPFSFHTPGNHDRFSQQPVSIYGSHSELTSSSSLPLWSRLPLPPLCPDTRCRAPSMRSMKSSTPRAMPTIRRR